MNRRPYAGKWISVLYRISQSYYDQGAEKFGIGSGHIPLLLCLYCNEGVTQEKISKIMHVDKATTARAITALEKLGYVLRKQDVADKRAYRVFLTEAGKSLEPKVRRVVKNWADIMTINFTGGEKEMAYQLLQRMAENVIVAKYDKWKILKQ